MYIDSDNEEICPMEWERTTPNKQITYNDKKKIFNRLAPRDCFLHQTRNDQINIKREEYFINSNLTWGNTKEDILNNIANERIIKPYCRICYKSDNNDLVIDHYHDTSKPGYYNMHEYPGYFRAFICKSCNTLESYAKVMNINERKNYWCKKKQWTLANKDFFVENLKNLGYL